MTSRPLLFLLVAATAGAITSCPTTAHASVSTAAWTTATTFCTGLKAGLSQQEAVRIALRDNRSFWSSEIGDPAFQRLFLAEVMQQCPGLMIDSATK
jgi:hypothetical protein